MNWQYWAYKWLGALLYLGVFPLVRLFSQFSGYHRTNLGQRQGHYHFPSGFRRQRPRIWLHAASVGEVGVAAAIIDHVQQLFPCCNLYLSTTTLQGLARARQRYGRCFPCFLAPLDFIGAVRRALNTVQPDVLVCVETELWPNWLVRARQQGCAVVMVNGRISPRSFAAYLKFPKMMAYVLKHLDAFSMISQEDAGRIIRLGASAGRVVVNGNAKYDALTEHPDRTAVQQLARELGLADGRMIWVAGSTRRGEEELMLSAYTQLRKQFNNLVLILVPRHIQRIPEICRLVTRHGCTWRLRSAPSNASGDVILLDTLGELPTVYALAHIAFCGGSLVPRGGQNILEAAVCGIPVLYGPFMSDFITEKVLLEASGGGIEVGDLTCLVETLKNLLAYPKKAAALGRQGRRAVLQNQGAAARHAAVIGTFLPKNSSRSL